MKLTQDSTDAIACVHDVNINTNVVIVAVHSSQAQCDTPSVDPLSPSYSRGYQIPLSGLDLASNADASLSVRDNLIKAAFVALLSYGGVTNPDNPAENQPAFNAGWTADGFTV